MKIRKLAVLAVLLLLVLPGFAFGAGSSFALTGSPKVVSVGGQQRVVFNSTFTADSANHTTPTLTISTASLTARPSGMYLVAIETVAGGTVPTTGWGVTLTDDMNVPLITVTNQSTSSATGVGSSLTTTIPVSGDLTATITGNLMNSATASVRFIFTSN